MYDSEGVAERLGKWKRKCKSFLKNGRFTGCGNKSGGNQPEPIILQELDIKSLAGWYFMEKVAWKRHSSRVVLLLSQAGGTTSSMIGTGFVFNSC